MLGGFEHERAIGGEEFGESGRVPEAAAERGDVGGVREKTVASGLLADGIGEGDGDDEVVLAAQSMEQSLERREQRHEQ